ncbi:hypothetical protein A3K73_07530 [Candidatus Pacearchaeota archaeon RBG_13_36_9]|nr:MAG: hypothetical protein A3K73_07530 [Candidatus Pacearchaeota archaeon RBG_13_36_9]
MEVKESSKFERALLNAGIEQGVIGGLEGETKIANILKEPTQLIPILKGIGVKLTDYVDREFRGKLFKDEIFEAKLTEEGAARVIDIGKSLNDFASLGRARELAELGKTEGIKALYFELTVQDLVNVCEYESYRSVLLA